LEIEANGHPDRRRSHPGRRFGFVVAETFEQARHRTKPEAPGGASPARVSRVCPGRNANVVVVGAGPVGQSAALLLARWGIR
jgi:alkyl hydroperoxide reductase subunit AhpF